MEKFCTPHASTRLHVSAFFNVGACPVALRVAFQENVHTFPTDEDENQTMLPVVSATVSSHDKRGQTARKNSELKMVGR